MELMPLPVGSRLMPIRLPAKGVRYWQRIAPATLGPAPPTPTDLTEFRLKLAALISLAHGVCEAEPAVAHFKPVGTTVESAVSTKPSVPTGRRASEEP